MQRFCFFLTWVFLGVVTSSCESSLKLDPGIIADSQGNIQHQDGAVYADSQSCATVTQKAELPPMDMVIALDTSYSMDFLLKWESVKAALKEFVKDPRFADLGVGLQYFPLRALCKVEDYAIPAVPIALLSTSADAMIASLDAQQMADGTPMVPLLQGLLTYTRQRVTETSQRKVVIVLVTDGIPDNTCLIGSLPNTLANVVEVAHEGRNNTPAIRTFVIGVGNELSSLNQISEAGGTGSAFLIDPTKDLQRDFLAALNNIRRQVACDYKVPPLPPTTTHVWYDYSKVKVQYKDQDKTEALTPVKDKAGCATSPDKGWYFDDPTKPTKIILCDETCTRLQKSDTGQVDVLFSCIELPE